MALSDDRPGFLGYFFRLSLIVLILGGLGFLAFAYFGDLAITPEPRSLPVEINRE